MVRRVIRVFLFSVLVWFVGSLPSYAQELTPMLNWDTKVSHELSPLGTNLFGDSIDYKTGSVTFQHTDVSLKGNDALQVAVKRRLSRGLLYDLSDSAEFGDWEMVVPRITAITSEDTNFRTGDRCSAPGQFQAVDIEFKANQPTGFYADPFIRGNQYSNGIQIETLEYGPEQLYARNAVTVAPYPSDARYITKGNTYVTCLDTATGGGEGFKAVSPDGITYIFDHFYELQTEDILFSNYSSAYVTRYRTIIAATSVTDRHGNTVDYTYDAQNRLTKIEGSDGREITFGYGASSNVIKTVTANGRTWSYAYEDTSLTYEYFEWGSDQSLVSQEFKTLKNVSQPDGLDWTFHARDMSRHPGVEGCTESMNSITVNTNSVSMVHPYGAAGHFAFDKIRRRVGEAFLETTSVRGVNSGEFGTIIPDGTTVELSCPGYGSFLADHVGSDPSAADAIMGLNNAIAQEISDLNGMLNSWVNSQSELDFIITAMAETQHRISALEALRDALIRNMQNATQEAPGDEGVQGLSSASSVPANLLSYKSMLALKRKSIVLSDTETLSWDMSYEEIPLRHYTNRDTVPAVSNGARTNYTRVKKPEGTVSEYKYHWDIEEFGGGLKSVEVFETDTSSAPIKSTNYGYTFIDDNFPWKPQLYFLYQPTTDLMPVFTTSIVTKQDEETTTQEVNYNRDRSSASYSFGYPVETKTYSSVLGSNVQRSTDITYDHITTEWILGLPISQVQNGRTVVENIYNADGLVTESKSYGETLYTVNYNVDGTISSVEDALNRQTSASSWKRGIPQLITRADGTTIAQDVDDNGWVIERQNARGFITSYERDNMGRLEKLIPSKTQKNWDDTIINHAFSGDDIVQTVTNGNARTTITHDLLLRPILAKTEDLTTPWVSYTNTRYGLSGQVEFTSRPSDIPTEIVGTNFIYDGLGRPLTQDDTTTVDVIDLTYDYLIDDATRVTDAQGEQTTAYKNGFDEVIKIEQPDDTTTLITRNEWGQITEVEQGGNHNNILVSEVQKYEYDSQQRLCRHHTPSGGSDLFDYNDAGELIYSSRGHDYAAGCSAPLVANRSEYHYDDMGRLEFTKYFDELTPYTRREYDANGNLKLLYRYPHELDEDPLWENDWRATSWRYDYNELDMLENETLKIVRRTFDLDYDYNLDGSLKESTRSYRHDSWPSGDIYSYDFDYARDGLGRATGVSMDGTSITSGAEYYPSGAMELMSYGNGLEFKQELDKRLMPKRLQVLGGSGSSIGHALDLNYTYTPRGMVEAMNDNVDITNSRFYEYDAQGRLETASGPWGSGSFTYDSVGNIRAKSLGNRNIILDYTDGLNRVTKSTDSGETGIRNITYDDRGNVEYLGEQRFFYSATDRPRVRRSTGAGNGFGKYRYDGHGRRISSWEREDGEWAYRYNAYDASGALVFIVEEGDRFPFNDTITHYVKQDGKTVARVKSTSLNSTPEITWLHHDHLGSAVAGTKADGTTAWREKYTPYGISMVDDAANNNQAGFTGHIKDSDTGLTYMQARYYDPVIGRFLSIDPVTFMDAGAPEMFNRYAYAINDPINHNDPTGEIVPALAVCAAMPACRGAFGAIGGAVISGGTAFFAGGDRHDIRKASMKGFVVGGVTATTLNPNVGVTAAATLGYVDGATTSHINGASTSESVYNGIVTAGTDAASVVAGNAAARQLVSRGRFTSMLGENGTSIATSILLSNSALGAQAAFNEAGDMVGVVKSQMNAANEGIRGMFERYEEMSKPDQDDSPYYDEN